MSIGKATLTINAPNGNALTHWSLPAVVRLNPGERPAIFGPDVDPMETLEIADTEMVDAIERVLGALRRKSLGSRWLGNSSRILVVLAALAALAFWLPGAITAYTASLVPDIAQAQIGEKLLIETERLTGAPCATPAGSKALETLSQRLFADGSTNLVVMPSTLKTTAHVPGGVPCAVDGRPLLPGQVLQCTDLGKLAAGLDGCAKAKAAVENGSAQGDEQQQGELHGTMRIDFVAANLTDAIGKQYDVECALHDCCRYC